MSTEGITPSAAPPAMEPPAMAPQAMEPRPEKARGSNPAGPRRTILLSILAACILFGIVALILYLVYRPSKPEFAVLGADLFDLRTSSLVNTTVSASIQFTVSVHNPSPSSSVSFDRLVAYVVFCDEPITPPSPVTPLYVGKGGTAAVAPLVGGGAAMPVSATAVSGLQDALACGEVGLRLVLMGRLKYKAGTFHSSKFRVFVGCELLMALPGKEIHGPATLLGIPGCSVDI